METKDTAQSHVGKGASTLANTYLLKNQELTVSICALGAEVVSVKRGNCEYIWQGDKAYWGSRAPLMFPICGRLFAQTYTHAGQSYKLGNHGFARHSVFSVERVTDVEAVFVLTSTPEIRAVYPFDFRLTVTYRLDGAKLTTTAVIRNTGSEFLPATFGGHPGFNVPLEGDGAFDSYYLEFGEACSPDRIEMSDTCFLTGKRSAYPLQNGRILPLRHSLFSVDAVFLSRVANRVTLRSPTTARAVTLEYPDMPYLGVWHAPRTEAPYVCIEPWCGLPAYDGEIEEITARHDMFRICAGEEKSVSFAVWFE